MNAFFCRTRSCSVSWKLIAIVAGTTLFPVGCARTAKKSAEPPSEPTMISVIVNPGGPVVLTTTRAEFQILPSGYVQALLLKDGQKLSLDDPRPGAPTGSNYLLQDS